MIPEAIPRLPTSQETICAWADRWKIDHLLAMKLAVGASYVPYPINIISGYRSEKEQDALRESGRPAADNDRSTHLTCPATGADIWTPTVTPVDAVKAAVGAAMVEAGLRWGGGSQVSEAGIPIDWNHFDLGPRVTTP